MNNKPLNTTLICTLLATLLSCFAYGQSNHTVSFTGNSSDFNVAEKIYGGDNVDYYVTFDDTYMYFAAFRVNSDIFNNYDHYTVYLDTDPKPSLTAGNGSTSGLNWDSNTPTMPFNADHRFVIRNNGLGESFHHKYTGASWDDQTSGSTSSFNQYTTSTALEIRIPLANIDAAKGIYFSMYMSYGGGFFGANDVNYPVSISGSTFSGYFGGIGLTNANCNPVDNKNQPIMDELVNANPVANTTYAYIDINDGDYSVTGDVTLAPGGTGSISAGKSLTINGDFDNNGYFELQSISNSYSSLLTTTASGSLSYKRHVNGNSGLGDLSAIGNNDLISAPVFGQAFGDFASANSNLLANPVDATEKAFAPFDKITGDYENYNTSTNALTTLVSGVGYRAASNDTGTLTFSGTVNTGTVTHDIKNSGPAYAAWNLIGNPYPSYLKVQDFLNYEVDSGVTNIDLFESTTAAIYGYDGDATGAGTSGYTVLNLANTDGTSVIAPGQGFLVSADILNVGHDVTFDPDMRTIGTTDDFITGRENNTLINLELQIAASSNTFVTDFYFNDNAMLGLDPGYDAAFFGETPDFALYSHLVQENVGIPFLLQALGNTDYENTTISLGINAAQGEQLTISISESTLPSSVNVYLDDTLENTSTLLTTSDYVLTPSTNLSGTGRFYLRLVNSTLSTLENNLEQLSIYSNQNEKTIVLSGQLLESTTATVYDIQGRVVNSSVLQNISGSQSIDVKHLNTGVYVVELTNGLQSKTQKVIIR